ncbi:dolichyl-phosphate-mannose-protein mannosyltransferase family protein 3 [Achromobacter xylosoxidans A8]|uniref:Dolichyl-phosphate-mannose-protein mannosyltransferase family protein 3 n=1 Tax=Achromobacter xylosoxidans (strain A8) TaxID=762376 RepID=E3HJ88_ACHXA|nr:glycosyltransferase family 39 protein [Achromobacter xylosoxidans]ADP17988.1 dolichyl-phosphate-mannose-protein mannosyltransferase family protein 3 [Achromobacter xylosoxidans A8]
MQLSARAVAAGLAAILGVRLLAMVLVPFADTSEPRYAEIARLMAESGDWITPWFAPGVPFWGKPPLGFWAEALSIRLLGLSEFSIRFPSLLATAATLAILYALGRRLYTAQAARWAVLVYASMFLPMVAAGAVLTDPFLALGVTLSMASFILSRGPAAGLWRYGFFLGLTIGLLSKGPLAAVLVAGAIVPWMLWQGTARADLRRLPWVAGAIMLAVLVLPWYVAAEIKTPGFLQYFIVGEHFLRFVDAGWSGDLYGSAHRRPYGAIWLDGVVASLPWGLFGVWLLARRWRGCGTAAQARRWLRRPRWTYLLAWGAATPVFFTLSGNILWTYVLPALPPLALAIGVCLSRARASAPGRAALACMALAPVAVIVFCAMLQANPERLKTEKQLVARADALMASNEKLYFVDSLPFSARYYSRGQAGLVPVDGVATVLPRESGRVFLAVEKADLPRVREQLGTVLAPVYSSRRYVLLIAGPQAPP